MKKEAKGKPRRSGEAAFYARLESIKKMFDEKYSKIVIFESHKEKLNISYSQFLRYVHRYLESEHHGKKPSGSIKDAPNKDITGRPITNRTKETQDGSRNEEIGTKPATGTGSTEGKNDERRKSNNLKDAFETEDTDGFGEP